jgi:type II secretory pathway pseudopilin PulG
VRARGATLIEIIVVIIISGILVVFIAPILTTAVDSYDRTSRNIEVLTKMRYAMERIAREIRTIRRDPLDAGSYDVVTGSMTATKFEFCRPDGTRVTIDNTTLASEIAIGYTAGFTSTCTASAASTRTLTDSVTAFSLTYRTVTGGVATGKTDVAYVDIAVTITGTGTSGYNSSMRVDLRNP